MVAYRLVLLGCFVAAATLGCSGKEHAPFIAPPPTTHHNGGTGNASDPSNEKPVEDPDAGEPSDGMDGGEPGDDAGDSTVEPGTGTLDADQVYWIGKTKDVSAWSFSTVGAPELYTLGINTYDGDAYAFANHAIWYQHPHGHVFKFVPDADGPPSPTQL